MSMVPELYKGEFFTIDDEGEEFIIPVSDYDPDLFSDDHEIADKLTGYSARLTMPGYLDCTEWLPPEETAAAVLFTLYELYGIDEDQQFYQFVTGSYDTAILAGSLRIVETFNCFNLYGRCFETGEEIFLHSLGDEKPHFRPNAEPDIEEAYNLRLFPSSLLPKKFGLLVFPVYAADDTAAKIFAKAYGLEG